MNQNDLKMFFETKPAQRRTQQHLTDAASLRNSSPFTDEIHFDVTFKKNKFDCDEYDPLELNIKIEINESNEFSNEQCETAATDNVSNFPNTNGEAENSFPVASDNVTLKPTLLLGNKTSVIKSLTDLNILTNVLSLQDKKLAFAKTKWQQKYELDKTRLKLKQRKLKLAETKLQLDYGIMKIRFKLEHEKLQLSKDAFRLSKEFKNQDEINSTALKKQLDELEKEIEILKLQSEVQL